MANKAPTKTIEELLNSEGISLSILQETSKISVEEKVALYSFLAREFLKKEEKETAVAVIECQEDKLKREMRGVEETIMRLEEQIMAYNGDDSISQDLARLEDSMNDYVDRSQRLRTSLAEKKKKTC